MDLSALRIFKAVAEEGSVTQAAARLHRVQSNVSARLGQLEEGLGVALFHRAGRRMLITAEGERLLSYADRLLNLAEEAQAAVAGARKPAGLLRIGAMETTAAARLPKVLAAFHGAYPDVDLQLETAPTDPLIQSVLNHKLDVALVAAPVDRSELVRQTVFEEELVNVLVLAFKTSNDQLPSGFIQSYDVNERPGGLVRAVNKQYELPAKISVGKFSGRAETVYHSKQSSANIFVFVLEGAFEVEGRLLHARDGLALWQTTAVEMEALSNDALVMLVEMATAR